MSDDNKERNELIKSAFDITKKSHNIFNRVEKYRGKLVYDLNTDVADLTKEDISDISYILQVYSWILSNALHELTGEELPNISEDIDKYCLEDTVHIKTKEKINE